MRHRKLRTIRLWKLLSILKRYAWRLTAFWCWAHSIFYLFGGKALLRSLHSDVFSEMIGVLSNLGFASGNAQLLPFVLRLLWILFITSFSWLQIVGLAFYVIFWPVVLLFLVRHWETLEGIRSKTMDSQNFRSLRQDRPIWTYALMTSLIAWFVLYGSSSLRTPLIVAIVLTGLLFSARVYRALVYTTLNDRTGRGWIDRYTAAAVVQLEGAVNNLREKKTLDLNSLSASLWSLRLSQRILRFFSRWLYGRAARTRAALFVLVKYMFNLCVLGGLAILFWALLIRYSSAPPMPNVGASLLASASRVIPGVPEPNKLVYPDWIKAAASITAWMVFVLYAGPVASLFPVLQERFIKETSMLYVRLRIARKALYAPIFHLNIAVSILRDNPEAQGLLNFLFFFKMQSDLNLLFSEEPNAARILSERPDLVRILNNAGITLPSLEQFFPPHATEDVGTFKTNASSPECTLPEKALLNETSSPERTELNTSGSPRDATDVPQRSDADQ